MAFFPQANATVNPPVPSSDGTTRSLCDVSSNADSGEGSLRQRLGFFNAEAVNPGQGKCLLNVYFLDPMVIQLESPLTIYNIQTRLRDGSFAGIYISGRNQAGTALPVVLDATQITNQPGQCAIIVREGLATFQQIHDVTVITRDRTRVICDQNGNDLLTRPIPPSSARTCPAGTLAQYCDFKDINIVVEPLLQPIPTPNDRDSDQIPDADDSCPDNADNNGQGENIDGDNDGLADACADSHLNDRDNDGLPDATDLCAQSTAGRTIRNNSANPRQKRAGILIQARQAAVAPTFEGCAALKEDADMDGDNIGDACDPDIDGDTLSNDSDPFACNTDGDGDLVPDNLDQCPTVAAASANAARPGCPSDGTPPFTPGDPEPIDEELDPITDPNETDPLPDTDNNAQNASSGGCVLSLQPGTASGVPYLLIALYSLIGTVRALKRNESTERN